MSEPALPPTEIDADAVRELFERGDAEAVRLFLASLSPPETADLLESVDEDLRDRIFPLLDTARQAHVLREVENETARDELIESITDAKLADIAESIPSDDAADLVEDIPEERRERVLGEIHPEIRGDIEELHAYPEDSAGGLMQKELLKINQDLTVAQAVEVIRNEWTQKIGEVYDIYVVDDQDRLLGRVRNRHLLISRPDRRIRDIMRPGVRRVPVTMDQEQIADIVKDYDLPSIAVVDENERLVGRILVDDIVDVMEEEATEDIHKLGGMQALDDSYLHVRVRQMIRKRAGWLAVLLVGELLTVSAMTYFNQQIQRAVVLGAFVPLIISSGGNSGSQATTLVIRAMALDEVRLRDWWRVVRREFLAGIGLGAVVGTLGALHVVIWRAAFDQYGEHAYLLALTVGLSLGGVVLWGTLVGSTLPFVMRRLGFDPASASAPFVATLVDVTGTILYFGMAILFLRGTLL